MAKGRHLLTALPHHGELYTGLQNLESQNTGALRMAALGLAGGDGLTICQATRAENRTASAALNITTSVIQILV